MKSANKKQSRERLRIPLSFEQTLQAAMETKPEKKAHPKRKLRAKKAS